jgi:hypothetical protein
MYPQNLHRQNRRGASVVGVFMVSSFLTTCVPSAAFAGVAADDAPMIELTSVPPYGSSEPLAGRVTGVNPNDYAVAVYIRIPPYGWFNRPNAAARVTTINPDGSWTANIATEELDRYATQVLAVLIPAAYQPPLMENHQCILEELLAYPYTHAYRFRAMKFANCDWMVRTAYDPVSPGYNYFSDSAENVWVDETGALHLKIARRGGLWYCSEVIADRSLGYGRYAFTVTGPLNLLDPNVVLAFFTRQECLREEHNREMDIEISRWSKSSLPNARFVVQPWDLPENQHAFELDPSGDPNLTTTHEFTWETGQVCFQSYLGEFALHPDPTTVLQSWCYTGPDVPVPGQENIHLNLWLANQLPPLDRQDVELRIDRVMYLPYEPNVVYRFWSPVNARHFYTISESEKDMVIATWPDVWTYEGPVYLTPAQGSHPGLAPVHRFWSDVLVAHFYTIDEAEKDYVIATYPDVWLYEGPAFLAWPDGRQPPGTTPVYRFWSDVLGTHFYTANEAEKDYVIATYPDVWTYETVAWHAYPLLPGGP